MAQLTTGLCQTSSLQVAAPKAAGGDARRTRPAAEEPQLLHGAGGCKWFNVHRGFGFLSMTAGAGSRRPPVDVFVHQSKLYMEGFPEPEGGAEAVEFTFLRVRQGPGIYPSHRPWWMFCIGSETRPKA